MAVTIPESHRDLIEGPHWAALTTLMPDGSPQTTPIWCNADHDRILINTMRGFRKEKNLRRNPQVTLLIYDPHDPQRHVEIRGRAVEMTEDGAVEHLDQLTQLYLGRSDARFFGDCVPLDEQAHHIPVKITIQPTSVRVEG